MAPEAPEEEGTSVTLAEPTRRKRAAASAPSPAAARLGHFQLLEPLGHGGMGTVYSAYDMRLDRKVAIKLLSQQSVTTEEQRSRNQRLLREAQAMAKLSHPNVVPVYEVGVDEGQVFIAMEYIAGQTVAAWLKDTRPGWREIVRVFAQAARGLAAAHDAGIVHRDLKPANMLIDTRGHVRVVDFGIAMMRGDPADERTPVTPVDFGNGDELTPPTPTTPLTEQGSIVGTPAYMSPEQYKSANVDARSDQFSFCVALWEALYRKRPFTGRGRTLADNVMQGALAKVDKTDVPGWVNAIAARGLERDPEQRWPSMHELADALERDPTRLRKRIAVGVLAAAVIAGGAALVGWRANAAHDEACSGAEARLAGVWDDSTRGAVAKSFAATGLPYAESSAQRVGVVLDTYRAQWIAARTDACRATRVRHEQSEHVLDLRVACLDRHRAELHVLASLLAGKVDAKTVEHSVDAASALGSLADCADTAALIAPDATPSDPAARARLAELRDRLDRLRADRRLGKHPLAEVRSLVGDARTAGDARMLAAALELQGSLETAAGELDAAKTTLSEALRRARAVSDPDLFVTVAIDVVDVLGESGISSSREALGVVRVAEALVDDTHDPALPIRLANEKADEYLTLAHPDTALPIIEQTFERAKRTLGPDHVLILQIHAMLGTAYAHLRKPAEARAEMDALVAAAARVQGPLHPTTLADRVHRCRVLGETDARAESIACFAAELPRAIEVVGAHDRNLLSDRGFYGMMLLELGKKADSRVVYAAAFADVPADAWGDKWFVGADLARSLGRLDNESGDHEAALAHCQRAQATSEGKHVSPLDSACIADAYLALGKPADALAALDAVKSVIEHADPMATDPSQIEVWQATYTRAAAAAKHR